MSTVTPPDGTVIDYDRYGDGPAVIFIGGATAYRATDEGTTQTARRLAAEGYTTVDYDRRGRGRSGDTQPWALDREVEDVAGLIKMADGTAALCTNSSGAGIALAAATAGAGVIVLVLHEPPFFAGQSFAAHLTVLRSLLAGGKNDEAMRYNLTSVIGLPADVDDQMARAPGWAAMTVVAPDQGLRPDRDARDQRRPRLAAPLGPVTVPAIVCSGDQTFPGMPEAADAVAAGQSL